MIAGMPVVFAQDKDLAPEVQLDLLVNSATKSMKAGRWEDAVQSFEKAMKLGVSSCPEIFISFTANLFIKREAMSTRYQVLLFTLH